MKALRTSSTRLRKPGKVFAVLAALVLLSAAASMCLGSASVTPKDIWQVMTGQAKGSALVIVRFVRWPRTCGCLLAGMALAVAGAVIQSVLANPLAAPNIIGVNSGAGMAVALAGALLPASVSLRLTPAAAFLGALLGVMLVLFIAEKTGAAKITLVLAGVAISSIFSAAIDAVVTFVPDSLNGYTDFRIGGLANLTMEKITPAFWVILPCMAVILSLTNELDVLMLGQETAQSLGLPAKRLRIVLLSLAAALAGAAVSFTGLLGFVGLIVPHIMRRLVGEEAKYLIPSTALGGAVMLTVCDVAARVLFRPFELPVGVVLSLVGGPFFIWLLLRQRKGRIHD